MAEPTKSLYQRLMERRQAIEAGDATGAAPGANAAAVRKETAPKSTKLTKRPGESDASFARRQALAGEL